MALATLKQDQLIRWRGCIYKIMGRMPNGCWHLIDITSGLMDDKSDEDIWSAFEKKELVFISEGDRRDGLQEKLVPKLSESAETFSCGPDDEEQRNKALKRLDYVRAVRGLSGKGICNALDELHQKFGWPESVPHINTILNWRRKVSSSTDPVAALVERHDCKGRHGDRYPSEVMDLARDTRDRYYLHPKRQYDVEQTLQVVKDRLTLENDRRTESERLPIPGRRLMERIIKEVPECERLAARYGPDVARAMLRNSLGGVAVEHVLDRCQIDHTTLGIIVLDDDDFMPMGRQNLSLAVDQKSKIPTGCYWGAEVPSIVSVARCMRHSVLPKIEFLKQFPNVKGRWDCFGVHSTYVFDNGLEEHAGGVRQAASELGGSVVEYCPRVSPWYKPDIERTFHGADQNLLQILPGSTLEDMLRKCRYNAKKDVLLRQSTFGRIFVKWLVDIFMRTPRRSLGNKASIDVWREDIGLVDQMVPTRTVLLERLFLRKEEDRRLDHEGVEYDCLKYNSADLGALRAELGAVLRVTIWVSDEDLGYIQVCVPNTGMWIRVPCLDLKYAQGMTRWQHKRCKEMKSLLKVEGRVVSLAEARTEIEREIENETKEFRHAHRKRYARMREKDSNFALPDESSSVPERTATMKEEDETSIVRDPDRKVPTFKSVVRLPETST